jgi:hypothetical protein
VASGVWPVARKIWKGVVLSGHRTLATGHYSIAPSTSASSAMRMTTPLNASCQ